MSTASHKRLAITWPYALNISAHISYKTCHMPCGLQNQRCDVLSPHTYLVFRLSAIVDMDVRSMVSAPQFVSINSALSDQ